MQKKIAVATAVLFFVTLPSFAKAKDDSNATSDLQSKWHLTVKGGEIIARKIIWGNGRCTIKPASSGGYQVHLMWKSPYQIKSLELKTKLKTLTSFWAQPNQEDILVRAWFKSCGGTPTWIERALPTVRKKVSAAAAKK